MATTLLGPISLSGSTDSEGYREYQVKQLVKADLTDGPHAVLFTAGLPTIGSFWNFLSDLDTYAWCKPDGTVMLHQHKEGDPHQYWVVTNNFTTKPISDSQAKLCNQGNSDDPLSEPQEISGTFTKFNQEAVFDRFRLPITNSAHELFRGPQNEWDASRPTVKIKQNVGALGLSTFFPMVDTLNSTTLWGLPRRSIKLSNVTWERKFYGQCYIYYTRTFDFDIRVKVTDSGTIVGDWDRDLLDEGTKVLNGHWGTPSGTGTNSGNGWILDDIDGATPDRLNPSHFVRFKDRNGENSRVILDGAGLPYDPNAVGGRYYWCINDPDSIPVCFLGTCAEALTQANLTSFSLWGTSAGRTKVHGPYYTQAACQERCSVSALIQDLLDYPVTACPQTNRPGSRHVEYYHESNFLLLQIPLSF